MKKIKVLISISCIYLLALVGSYACLKYSISQSEKSIASLKNEINLLQDQKENLREQQIEYEAKIERLETEIWRYSPVVIPD